MPWSIVAIILGEMALLGLVIWLVAIRLQERAHWRFDLQTRLLERFSSPAELQQFLESEGGRRLLQSLSVRRAPGPRILFALQAGIVLTAFGFGLLAADLEAWGVPVVFLGLGLVIAALVSRWLARAWGLHGHGSPAVEGDAAP